MGNPGAGHFLLIIWHWKEDGDYGERVLSASLTSFDAGSFALARNAGASQPGFGFIIRGIHLHVAVKCVCLRPEGGVQNLLYYCLVVTLTVCFETTFIFNCNSQNL